MFFFFFFQAEDGIRDLYVTGVQTCALPISFNTSLPYWQEAEAGLNDAAKQMGVKAELTGPPAFSPNEELTAFQQAIAQKPSGILLSASNPEIFKAPISAAIQQGI